MHNIKVGLTNQGGTAGKEISSLTFVITNVRDFFIKNKGINTMKKILAPKGTKDILPKEVLYWEYLEKRIKKAAKRLGYKQIRTPMFEEEALFKRSVGDSTDIVEKEMYTLKSRGKDEFALKPEGTAAVVRAYIEHGMASNPSPVKLYYLTPCFRGERPQKGRLREFHQFGIEAFGAEGPSIDAEIIMLADSLFKNLGIKGISLEINSVGCPQCRDNYYKKLREFLASKKDDLCDDCKRRMDKNPMRVLDCKKDQEILTDAPLMIDNLCDSCETHFEGLKTYLNAAKIDFEINPRIVRGLDYYSKTAFEFVSNELGAQGTVCGGGRYDGLTKMLGGPDTPAIGFAMGIERILIIMEEQGLLKSIDEKREKKFDIDLYIAPLGEAERLKAFSLLKELEANGLKVQMDYMDRSLKAQLKYAGKINTRFAAIIGEEELAKEICTIRDMWHKDQWEVNLNDITDFIQDKL